MMTMLTLWIVSVIGLGMSHPHSPSTTQASSTAAPPEAVIELDTWPMVAAGQNLSIYEGQYFQLNCKIPHFKYEPTTEHPGRMSWIKTALNGHKDYMRRVEENMAYPAEFYSPLELSMEIHTASVDDSGQYRCEFDYPWFKNTSDIFVTVKPRQVCWPNMKHGGNIVKRYSIKRKHVINPRRGFVKVIPIDVNHSVNLTAEYLNGLREAHRVTVVNLQYIIGSFVELKINDATLTRMYIELTAVRDARFTVILQFYYNQEILEHSINYDSSAENMVDHIKQLKELFVEFGDIIDYVQAGFIGAKGNWVDTWNEFGDPESPDEGYPNGYTPDQQKHRDVVLDALLDAVPRHIQIQVPAPRFKRVYSTQPVTQSESMSSSKAARIGYHNNCFMGSNFDNGFYVEPLKEFPFLEKDTLYNSMGGTTCSKTPKKLKCQDVVQELSRLHFSYLDLDNQPDVVPPRKCKSQIQHNLGYRITLTRVIFPRTIKIRDIFCVGVQLKNIGWAAPSREYTVKLILEHRPQTLFAADFKGVNTRWWTRNKVINLNQKFRIPRTVSPKEGQYKVYLAIIDKRRPEWVDFNIMLSNNDVNIDNKGINKLHIFTVIKRAKKGRKPNPNVDAINFERYIYPSESGHSRNYRLDVNSPASD